MAAYRFRKCPRCGNVCAGGDLPVVHLGTHWKRDGDGLRQCPRCGFTAVTASFVIVNKERSSSALAGTKGTDQMD